MYIKLYNRENSGVRKERKRSWSSSFCVCDLVEEPKLCKRISELTSLDRQVCNTFVISAYLYIYEIVYGWMHVYLAAHYFQIYLCKCCLHLPVKWKIKEPINFSPRESSKFYDTLVDSSLPTYLGIYVFISYFDLVMCPFYFILLTCEKHL